VFSAFVTDIDAMGLSEGQGLVLPSGFYWDDNDQTRAFASRFFKLMKKMPTNSHALAYAAATHYSRRFRLQAPVRADGRVTYDISLYQVKSPSESKAAWDYMKSLGTVSQCDTFRPFRKRVPACSQQVGQIVRTRFAFLRGGAMIRLIVCIRKLPHLSQEVSTLLTRRAWTFGSKECRCATDQAIHSDPPLWAGRIG